MSNENAWCCGCGQRYPQHPADPEHVEVHSLGLTGGYGSRFPGDLCRLSIPVCELCVMLLCSASPEHPTLSDVWPSGASVSAPQPLSAVQRLAGLCLADEAAALEVASVESEGPAASERLREQVCLARYLIHRHRYGDPQPARTQRVAAALSRTLDAEGSAWQSAEDIGDAHAARCALGVTKERAKELRRLVRDLATAA